MQDIEAKIFQHLSGKSDSKTDAAIAGWRKTSAVNEAIYQQMVKLHKVTAHREHLPGLDLDASFQELASRIAKNDNQNTTVTSISEHPRFKAKPLLTMLAMAAVLVAGFLFLNNPSAELPVHTTALAETEIQQGRDYTMAMAPSTKIRMLEDSSERFVARVEGKINFDVSTKGREFILETAAATVKVLGTKFALRSRDGITSIVVFHGKVAFQDRQGGEPVFLTAGKQATCAIGGAISSIVNLGDDLQKIWTPLTFYRSSLSEVLSDLKAHYGVTIELDPRIDPKQTLTAQYQSEEKLSHVISEIALTLGLEVRQDQNNWQIHPL